MKFQFLGLCLSQGTGRPHPSPLSPLGIDFDTICLLPHLCLISHTEPGCVVVHKAFSCFHMTKNEPHTLACRQAVCLVCLPTARQPALVCCALPFGNCGGSLTGAHSPLQRHPPLSCAEPSCETGLGLSCAALLPARWWQLPSHTCALLFLCWLSSPGWRGRNASGVLKAPAFTCVRTAVLLFLSSSCPGWEQMGDGRHSITTGS